MIIDAHNHPDWYGFGKHKFLKNMDQHQIDVTWLLSWEQPLDEYSNALFSLVPDPDESGPISHKRCIDYVQSHPDRFVPGWAPDPRRPWAIERLKHAIELYGVRICGEVKLRMMYDDPDAIRLFRFCGEQGLPVVLHLEYENVALSGSMRPSWWWGGRIETLEYVLRQCPETNFLGHAPGFWTHISGGEGLEQQQSVLGGKVQPGGTVPALLERFPNLYCDLSAGSGYRALARDKTFAHHFLTTFQDRILYGRDCFDNKHQDLLNSLELPAPVLDKIYAGNALRLVPLTRNDGGKEG